MRSGIYSLQFSNGQFYIGKTNDFDRRWVEHFEKMRKGTAAKNMQQAYNNYGFPTTKVIFECHEDHTSLMEAFYIGGNRGPNMLNATFPISGSASDLRVLNQNDEALKYSTADILEAWRLSREERSRLITQNTLGETKLINEISELKEGTVIPALELKLQNSEKELNRLKNRGFFSRLFNT